MSQVHDRCEADTDSIKNRYRVDMKRKQIRCQKETVQTRTEADTD